MGWLGTLIGGGLGFMLGGPLGAIIGGAIGSNVGEVGETRSHAGRSGGARPGFGAATVGTDPRQAQQAFLVAVISLAAKVAKADGRVSQSEIQSFDRFLKDSLGMDAEDRRAAARVFNEAKNSDIPAEQFARQIRQLLGHQPDRMRDLISLLMSIAMADGRLDPAEEQMIRSIADTLGLTARDYEEARAMFNPTVNLDAAYATLGVFPHAENSEVKAAYRRLAKEYHPDVVANKGMGEDFQKFAAEKMRAVNDAYDRVREARGM